MKVLIIGSGGREHAIADAFSRSKEVEGICVSPGNAGIALFYPTIKLDSPTEIRNYCIQNQYDMVFVGPEQPIEAGLGDFLRACQIPVIAPSQAAGRLESSKVFCKNLLDEYSIPTAKYRTADSYDAALSALQDFSYPLVIKADGLAAGKGVVIVQNEEEALLALSNMMISKEHGDAGTEVVLEEFLNGWEVSLFVITDGFHFQSMLFSQDHKQLYDDDKGPNTGGMGAFAPVPEAEIYRDEIEKKIIEPTLRAMREKNCPYQGILYCGLMITTQGPKVIEYNCRFGDPETQAVLALLETDFVSICDAILNSKVQDLKLNWKQDTAVCVVLASGGYPGKHETGYDINIINPISSTLFYAGVSSKNKSLITSGGRVLNLLAIAPTLKAAREAVYRDIQNIDFVGKTYRKDIGLRINHI